MKRLRFTIVVAALILCLPLGLLVSRAIRSVEAEQDLRHEIVAERVFDEMERELTAFLRTEEERPFEHYRYFYIYDEDAPEAALVRSPLADLPKETFVVGHFHVDSEGAVSTPLVDGELVPKPVRGWEPSESLHRAVTTIHAVVGDRWSDVDDNSSFLTASREPEIRIERVERIEQAVTSEQYLRALNKGAFARQNRLTQNAYTAVQNMMPPTKATTLAPRTGEVFLGTMVGERVDGERFLLHRRVSVEDSVYRQGLVLELGPLVTWLERRVLKENELQSRARLFLTSLADADGPGYRFRHRFAEPFQDIESILVLATLPEPGGANYVYLLSALLVATASAGLYGLYRMVAAELAFAEKRQSFVSAVSHELRTPLTAIRMHAEMLRDGVVLEEGKRQQYYEVMTAESERLTRLVNNVLEMSKLERDEPRPEPAAGPLRPVLDQVLETLGPHARQEGFELRVDIESELPDATHDRDGLLQVLFNLVDNAIKYGGATGTNNEISIRTRAVEANVEIEVSDYGPGVDEAQLPHVFEPYYRGKTPDASSTKGSGMGLALVRRLVESIGGTVRGDNGDHGGFTVTVRLVAHWASD